MRAPRLKNANTPVVGGRPTTQNTHPHFVLLVKHLVVVAVDARGSTGGVRKLHKRKPKGFTAVSGNEDAVLRDGAGGRQALPQESRQLGQQVLRRHGQPIDDHQPAGVQPHDIVAAAFFFVLAVGEVLDTERRKKTSTETKERDTEAGGAAGNSTPVEWVGRELEQQQQGQRQTTTTPTTRRHRKRGKKKRWALCARVNTYVCVWVCG